MVKKIIIALLLTTTSVFAEVKRYCIVDDKNIVQNVVKWDGKNWTPPKGFVLTECNIGPGYVYDPVKKTYSPPPKPKVKAVSRIQARLALSKAGKLKAVRTAIANADEETQVWYEDAQVWNRDSPILIEFAKSLGMTSEEIDQLFELAATLGN